MRLSKIHVYNFKSIKDSGDIYLSGTNLITVLAGQNESGKTALLKALKFFQEGAYDGFDDDRRLGDEYPRVEVTFMLQDDEYEELKNATNKKIADYFKQHGFAWVRGSTKNLDCDSLKYFKFDEEIEKAIDELNKSVEDESDKNEEEEDDEEENGEDEEKFNAYNFFSSIRPKFVYYASDLDKNILPNQIKVSEIDTNQAVLDFQKVYGIDIASQFEDGVSEQSRLQKSTEIEQKASESLNTYWHQKINNEKAEYKYRISMTKIPTSSDQSTISFYVDHGNNMPLKMSQKSQGFRWFSGFILRLRAHNVNRNSGNVILLIDEPGQGLHETAQKDVLNVIEEISKESGMQILYTTHQPILLGGENLHLSRIMLVEKDKNGNSTFKTIPQTTSSKGLKDALSPIRSALGLVTILNPPKIGETVVVEGMSDYLIFKVFFGEEVCIIPALGANQLPNIFTILFGWGIQPKAILDGDKKGKEVYRKVKKEFFDVCQEEIGKFIYTISDNLEIEDLISENDISKVLEAQGKTYDATKSKVDNIEQFLGKTIFAKLFYDKFKDNKTELEKETVENFARIEEWLKQTV